MADYEGSVAPKERVNIVYKAHVGDVQEEKELPFKSLVVGDFTGRADSSPIEERKLANVDKDNFDDVLASQDIKVTAAVPNVLSEEEGASLAVELDIKSMKDFGPESVAQQVPELAKLLELRQALAALRGPLGNVPSFRKKIQAIIKDETQRAAVMGEIQGGGDEG
ncbi:MAG: type VI secretion system contractile sheath small subunit [Planctomycetota bacterium]|jgi:type VI secretion system protein ImpB|nr:type VI secretion system contractile sheath small subunit [Planctomycetota bacterium]